MAPGNRESNHDYFRACYHDCQGEAVIFFTTFLRNFKPIAKFWRIEGSSRSVPGNVRADYMGSAERSRGICRRGKTLLSDIMPDLDLEKGPTIRVVSRLNVSAVHFYNTVADR